ncbi:hypothetical protein GWK47_037716 [Chionoecetes opilio]|uniref:Reverse transcriptase domain-containing protein n=1 Tax=Chionoecetes opilio TaxID=41210 RepID=A0A8J4YD87_CHIOP|nr:hypothetical protein GWK47_037716 [Chionoecetes opilio]
MRRKQAGGEAAIHAMRRSSPKKTVKRFFSGRKNAFNSINRKTMLHNIKIKCPSLVTYADNTYSEPSNLYVNRSGSNKARVLESREGTTQGDPVAMAMYALGMSVLQEVIAFEKTKVKQVAYADDLSGAGKLQDLSHWWGLIQANGPTIGYTPNAAKSFLIVKPEHYDGAVNIFSGSGVVVTKEGQRHLGAVIGTEEYKKEYVGRKCLVGARGRCPVSPWPRPSLTQPTRHTRMACNIGGTSSCAPSRTSALTSDRWRNL